MPKKFFKELKGTGPTSNVALTQQELDHALDEYYRLAGWTPDGIPTQKTLEKLDIAWAM